MTLLVEKAEDWLQIAALGGPVVDPMILRCGELFLRGAAGANSPAEAWDLINRNIHALGTFFDRLVLDQRIPAFNYADSFDVNQNFDKRTLSQVNVNEELLVDVNVRYDAYQDVKAAALAELQKLYDGSGPRVDAADAQNVLGELSSSGYAWYPQLDQLSVPNDTERRLAAYLLGGLIFGAYAQLAGTGHLMQPKRSRLFLAISLHQKTSRAGEEQLFESLAQLSGRPTADIPYTPTFFPLLLAQSTGPAELLRNALKLRESGEVRDYRSWLHEALTDFDVNGRISAKTVADVQQVAIAIERKLAGLPIPRVEIKMTVADVALAKPPSVGLDLTKPASALWGWAIDRLPGRRHRKLLTRAALADREYVALDRRVQTVWSGEGLSV